MLEVTRISDSDAALRQQVAEQCSKCGLVKRVQLCRTGNDQPYSYVLVEMLNREQTYEVAYAFGGSTFGTCALIHLKEKSRH